jgi:primosomal protein N' (replication factor Y)
LLISARLKEELEKAFENHEQSILLLNRRGYNTFVSCASCGEVITCPNCSISMTYHKANNRIMCHYCGYSSSLDIECPNCHQKNIRYSGSGTQKIEEALQKAVPDAKILRMDTDTTLTKQAHEKMLKAFAAGEYDILIGTQMVAKGFDFPNVTLSAVVSADQTLYNYDYRSVENTFDLITQLAGRSGRSSKRGTAVLQTSTPDNPVIALAAKQDYEKFYETEIEMRKLMIYPPFCDLCLVGFISQKEAEASMGALYFLNRLKELNSDLFKEQKLIVLGPAPAKLLKTNNKYRYRLIIKCKNSPRFRKMISCILCDIEKNKDFKNTTVFADVNPVDIM